MFSWLPHSMIKTGSRQVYLCGHLIMQRVRFEQSFFKVSFDGTSNDQYSRKLFCSAKDVKSNDMIFNLIGFFDIRYPFIESYANTNALYSC